MNWYDNRDWLTLFSPIHLVNISACPEWLCFNVVLILPSKPIPDTKLCTFHTCLIDVCMFVYKHDRWPLTFDLCVPMPWFHAHIKYLPLLLEITKYSLEYQEFLGLFQENPWKSQLYLVRVMCYRWSHTQVNPFMCKALSDKFHLYFLHYWKYLTFKQTNFFAREMYVTLS